MYLVCSKDITVCDECFSPLALQGTNVAVQCDKEGWNCSTLCGWIFFWTRFKNLVAKRRKINDRVAPILVAIRNWNDVICL